MFRRYMMVIFAMVAALFVSPLGHAEELVLPEVGSSGGVVAGDATIGVPDNGKLTITQSSQRAVIRWESFNIKGTGAWVDFDQAKGADAAVLNIVHGNGRSELAGKLTAQGSVLLINPWGITVTEQGDINTGGAFIASTLQAVDDANFTTFMGGATRLEFVAGSRAEDVVNEGTITARDVLLLGSRVFNKGTITAQLGRVALGSASEATLDLTGDGFLQVLAPAEIADPEGDALITHTGIIDAEGGLVQLKAYTAYEAVREAINMPGTISAKSVSGSEGRIIFGTGKGSPITIDGHLDVSPSEQGAGGGQIDIVGSNVKLDFSTLSLGEGGHFSLTADDIVVSIASSIPPGDNMTTWIAEDGTWGPRSDIGDLLRKGINVTLHANDSLYWSSDSGLIITADEVTATSGKAGDLRLLAGRRIVMDGIYATYNSDWTLIVNVPSLSGINLEAYQEARINFNGGELQFPTQYSNGHLVLQAFEADEKLSSVVIELPVRYRGKSLAASILSLDGDGDQDLSGTIAIRGDIDVDGVIELSGHLDLYGAPQGRVELKGRQVTWVTEQASRLSGPDNVILTFVEKREGGEVVTRIGRGGIEDATRLVLGSNVRSFQRRYGDANPDQIALGDLVLSLAPDYRLLPGEYSPGEGAIINGWPVINFPEEGIPLSEILAEGSISVTGPDKTAGISKPGGPRYYLTLSVTESFAFKPLVAVHHDYEDNGGFIREYEYVSGALGGYWIDLTGPNQVELEIIPRPLTIRVLDPEYEYGSLQAVIELEGLVDGDVLLPVGTLKLNTASTANDAQYHVGDNGLVFLPTRTPKGTYIYTLTGLVGENVDLENYDFDLREPLQGTATIHPRKVHYTIGTGQRTYGETTLPSIQLTTVLAEDNVEAVVTLVDKNDTSKTWPNIARVPAGEYEVKVVLLTGDDADNYQLESGTNGTLVINRKVLDWRVPDLSSTYGTLARPGAVLTGVVPGDEQLVEGVVHVALPLGWELTAKTPAGQYVMSVVDLAGEAKDNYEVAAIGTTGILDIRPKPLSLATTPIIIVYGETSYGGGTRQLGTYPLPELWGVEPGDVVELKPDHLKLLLAAGGGQSDVDIPAGTYRIRANDAIASADWDPLDGNDKGNYSLSPETINARDVQLIVQPRPLEIIIDNPVTEYRSDYDPIVRLAGVLEGDDVSVDPESFRIVRGSGSRQLHGIMDYPPGTYPIVVTWGTVSGANASNYSWPETVGELLVEPRTINFGPSVSIVYGQFLDLAAPVAVPYPHVISPDSVQMRIAIKLEDGTLTFRPPGGAGVYDAVIAELTGPDAWKYRLPADLEDRVVGAVTVDKRPVTVSVPTFEWRYGDPLSTVPRIVDNVVPGDAVPGNFRFVVRSASGQIVYDSATQIIYTGRISVGTYTVEIVGLDDPNYKLAESGNTPGTMTVFPRPIRYITQNRTIEYGQSESPSNLGVAALFDEDIVPGDDVIAGPVVVRFRELLPSRLEVGQYDLVPAGLEGVHAENYVLTDAGSQRGLLTVEPRQIVFGTNLLTFNGIPIGSTSTTSWVYGAFEKQFGRIGDRKNAFSFQFDEWFGLLPGDDVRYVLEEPELKFSSQGYLAAGTYAWTVKLEGADARNYALPNSGVAAGLVIRPRPVNVTFNLAPIVYGDAFTGAMFESPVFDFEGEDDAFFAGADFELAPLMLYGIGSFAIAVDDLWANPAPAPTVGRYTLRLLDPDAHPFRGPDAANFTLGSGTSSLLGVIEVNPRKVTLTPPRWYPTWIYGYGPTDFRYLYGDVVAAVGDGRVTGFLPGDDVDVEFVVGWRLDEDGLPTETEFPYLWRWGVDRYGRGNVPQKYPDPNANVGTYGHFEFQLVGSDAHKYELVQPAYTVTVTPRPLRLWGVHFESVYGEEVRPGASDLGGVLDGDDCCTLGWYDAEGNLIPVSKLKAGEYRISYETVDASPGNDPYLRYVPLNLGLIGADASNYILMTGGRYTVLRIEPRPIWYSIEDVAGQYGNFLPCDDPRTCNGGYKPGAWDPVERWANVWTPGLTTGKVTLYGVLPGDDVQPGEVLLVDVMGRTGRLADVPEPGIYFQVLSGVAGEDARNYRIADSGNIPGVLTIHRTWVRWKAWDALYTPEWGFLSVTPENTWASGLGADVWIGDKMIFPKPRFGLYWYPPEFAWLSPEYWVRVQQWAVKNYPGYYYLIVEGFVGDDDKYFIPFPWDFDVVGEMTAFSDSTLGINFVGRVSNPLGDKPVTADELRRQEEQEFYGDSGEVTFGEITIRRAGPYEDSPSGAFMQFGRNINYEKALASDVAAQAYAGALAKYNVTGVSLEVSAGVQVVYTTGQGYVRGGVDSGASVGADAGPFSAEASAEAAVGVNAGGGVEGDLGAIAGEVGARAEAKAQVGLGVKDGQLILGQELKAGAGVYIGTSGSLDLGDVVIDAGVTMYSPGIFAADASLGFAVQDGVLKLGFRGGLAIPIIGGISFSFVVGIDLDAVKDALQDVAEFVNSVVQGIECAFGGDCGPTPEDIGRAQLQAAMEIDDPLLRAAYLRENGYWTVLSRSSLEPSLQRALSESWQLLETLDRLERNLQQYVNAERALHQEFMTALQKDPSAALRMAKDIMNSQWHAGGTNSRLGQAVQQDLEALNLSLVGHADGSVTFRWNGW